MIGRIIFAFVAVSPTGCSIEDRRDEKAVVVVEGFRTATVRPGIAATATSMPPQPVAGPTPTPTATSTVGLGIPMPVRGDFTEKPLPRELAHLNGLGARSSKQAEPSYEESIP